MLSLLLFLNGINQASFRLFLFVLFKQFLQHKTVDFSKIRTWIVGEESDHMTRFTALLAK